MHRKHIHKSRRKRFQRKNKRLERFLTAHLLIVLGFFFLVVGGYYSMDFAKVKTSYIDMLMKLFIPNNDHQVIDVTGTGLIYLLLYYIPTIGALIASIYYSSKFKSIAYYTSIVVSIYLIVIQIKINIFKSYL